MTPLEKLNQIPKWAYLSVSYIAILGALYLAFMVTINKFETLSEASLDHFKEAYEGNIALTTEQASDSLTADQKDVLLRKVTVIEHNKLHHLGIVKKLYKNNYALLTLFPFLSAITAIIAFLIVQKGWSLSGPYLKNYFILFTTLTALVGIYPEVYQQEEGIDKNLRNYLEYEKIQKNVFSYSLTAPLFNKDTIAFDPFIDMINMQEKQLSNIIFKVKKKSVSKSIFELEENQ